MKIMQNEQKAPFRFPSMYKLDGFRGYWFSLEEVLPADGTVIEILSYFEEGKTGHVETGVYKEYEFWDSDGNDWHISSYNYWRFLPSETASLAEKLIEL